MLILAGILISGFKTDEVQAVAHATPHVSHAAAPHTSPRVSHTTPKVNTPRVSPRIKTATPSIKSNQAKNVAKPKGAPNTLRFSAVFDGAGPKIVSVPLVKHRNEILKIGRAHV